MSADEEHVDECPVCGASNDTQTWKCNACGKPFGGKSGVSK